MQNICGLFDRLPPLNNQTPVGLWINSLDIDVTFTNSFIRLFIETDSKQWNSTVCTFNKNALAAPQLADWSQVCLQMMILLWLEAVLISHICLGMSSACRITIGIIGLREESAAHHFKTKSSVSFLCAAQAPSGASAVKCLSSISARRLISALPNCRESQPAHAGREREPRIRCVSRSCFTRSNTPCIWRRRCRLKSTSWILNYWHPPPSDAARHS